MAKDGKKAAGGPVKKKKAKSVKLGDGVQIKLKVKDKAGKSGKAGKSKAAGDRGAFDSLARLAEHPIVADLIAVGATAAVAAIAEHGLGGKGAKGSTATRSGNAAKAAGKAAAAAIGRRLVSEFNAVKDAAKDAGKKA